jgi:hypothetical protein
MISLPVALNRRMSEIENVNWSAVAVRAFQKELGRLAQDKKEKNMEDVIERLRASKLDRENQFFKDGFKAGQNWAKNAAQVAELERLSDERDFPELYGDWEERWTGGGNFSSGQLLADLLLGEDDPMVAQMDTKLMEILGVHNWEDLGRNGHFMRGFAEGALDIWNAVKDHI